MIAITKQPRVNGAIRARKVRLIDENGEHVGVVELSKALDRASDAGQDLVEISPGADPPVVRVMDYGKYQYRQSRKARKARKKQHRGSLKEIKFRPNTDDHDYDFKMRHAREFLQDRHKVKATVVFRGRQLVYKNQGYDLLEKLASDLEEYGKIEKEPVLEGKLLTMIVSPLKENK